MSPRDEAGYRLRLAHARLDDASFALDGRRWANAALFARAAMENAAKAVLACFQAVPRTHEPADVLRAALSAPSFPTAVRARAERLAPRLDGYGLARHLQLSYGDERNLLLPDEIVSEDDAREAAAVAADTVAVAHDVVDVLQRG